MSADFIPFLKRKVTFEFLNHVILGLGSCGQRALCCCCGDRGSGSVAYLLPQLLLQSITLALYRRMNIKPLPNTSREQD